MPRGKKKVVSKRERVPFGGNRLRLDAGERSGYVRRWFNHTEDRLERALDAGYQFVMDDVKVGDGQIHEENSDLNGRVSKIVSKGGKSVVRAFLMEIPKRYYDADQKEKEKRNRMVDDAIRAGTPGGATVENAYVPSTGIKHTHG